MKQMMLLKYFKKQNKLIYKVDLKLSLWFKPDPVAGKLVNHIFRFFTSPNLFNLSQLKKCGPCVLMFKICIICIIWLKFTTVQFVM